MYNQDSYGIFNPAIFKLQLKECEEELENAKIAKMVNSIKDYIETLRTLEPEYHQRAFEACVDEIIRQSVIGNQLNKNW